jgi:hypothetical protein
MAGVIAVSLEGDFTSRTAGAHEKGLAHMLAISRLVGATECLGDLLKIVT